jgi:hypothetical protein
VAQDQRNVYKIIADLADRSAANKNIDPENINSSARFNEYFGVFTQNNADSEVSKDSLPMIKFYESANIDLAKAEKVSMKLARKALILGSPSEMLVNYNTDNYDSMNIKVNNSSDDFAARNKLLKLSKKLRAQPSVSSNIAVDENIELNNSSLSQIGLSAFNNNNNFLDSLVFISEKLASSTSSSD